MIEGELEVLGNLLMTLAQGIFARPATYPVVLRLSTNPGDMLDDSISAPRRMVIGVEGERLEGYRTQDFVMVNAPIFAASDPAAFAKNLRLLAPTTDTGQGWNKAFSAALRGAEAAVEAAGSESPMLTMMGGQTLTHSLGETFYTQTPFRYGDYVAKLSLASVSPARRALFGQPVETRGLPNRLHEEVIHSLREHEAEWELRVQLRINPETMPIEDASAIWPEDESPYVAVARIRPPRQPAWNEVRARQVDDALVFSPWHGIEAHWPLGGVNRARKDAYGAAADFRSELNRCSIAEPTSRPSLAGGSARTYGTAPGREGRRTRAGAPLGASVASRSTRACAMQPPERRAA
ncbi:catalase family protein [uncultured Jannaschia sp.]|uniref:catalase family protein n=1 Tax=uncultured Jannaschia sp. TaxID=293347 RepID=UPI00260CC9F4|nr:catalase family protein [uncultured Jannaschia sp.]